MSINIPPDTEELILGKNWAISLRQLFGFLILDLHFPSCIKFNFPHSQISPIPTYSSITHYLRLRKCFIKSRSSPSSPKKEEIIIKRKRLLSDVLVRVKPKLSYSSKPRTNSTWFHQGDTTASLSLLLRVLVLYLLNSFYQQTHNSQVSLLISELYTNWKLYLQSVPLILVLQLNQWTATIKCLFFDQHNQTQDCPRC